MMLLLVVYVDWSVLVNGYGVFWGVKARLTAGIVGCNVEVIRMIYRCL